MTVEPSPSSPPSSDEGIRSSWRAARKRSATAACGSFLVERCYPERAISGLPSGSCPKSFGIRVNWVGEPIFSVRDGASPYRIHFIEATIDGEPCAREHLAVDWVPVDELLELALAPADRNFVLEFLQPGS